MFVIDRNDSSTESEVDLKVTWCDDSDCLPGTTLNVIGRGTQDSLDLITFGNQIVPENSKILRVKFENRMEDKVPWNCITSGSRWELTLRMPCASFQIKCPNTFVWMNGLWINESCLCGSTNHVHVEPV